MTVAGGGLVGVVQSYASAAADAPGVVAGPRPVGRARASSPGLRLLIIGGSRGLGEVTAKLLAAGGARLVISYRVGARRGRSGGAGDPRLLAAYARRSPMMRAFRPGRSWLGSPPRPRTPITSPPLRSV